MSSLNALPGTKMNWKEPHRNPPPQCALVPAPPPHRLLHNTVSGLSGLQHHQDCRNPTTLRAGKAQVRTYLYAANAPTNDTSIALAAQLETQLNATSVLPNNVGLQSRSMTNDWIMQAATAVTLVPRAPGRSHNGTVQVTAEATPAPKALGKTHNGNNGAAANH